MYIALHKDKVFLICFIKVCLWCKRCRRKEMRGVDRCLKYKVSIEKRFIQTQKANQ